MHLAGRRIKIDCYATSGSYVGTHSLWWLVIRLVAVQVAEGQGRWLFERLTTTKILDWLEGPEAEEVREKRRVELALIDSSNLVVVVSPQEVELIKHYRPDTKVGDKHSCTADAFQIFSLL